MSSASIIHVIGDSHTSAFQGSEFFKVHHIGPATAFNLGKEKSSNRSLDKLNIVLNCTGKENPILLVFGEIDCRIHIYHQYRKTGENISISELIDQTIQEYGKVMDRLKTEGYNVAICGIVPVGTEDNIYGYDFYAAPELRTEIYRDFNSKLASFCIKSGFRYLDLYTLTSDVKGYMLPEYTDDGVHLNSKTLPQIEQWAMDEFNMGKDKSKSGSGTDVNISDTLYSHSNVKDISKRIRENIHRRTEAISCSDHKLKSFSHGLTDLTDDNPDLERKLEFIRTHWEVANNAYYISSHRPVAGKILVKGRELVHGEVKRYVDPVFWQQSEFNENLVYYLNGLHEKTNQIDNQLKDDSRQLRSLISEVDSRISHEIKSKVDERVNSMFASINRDIENKAWLSSIIEKNKEETSENKNLHFVSDESLNIDYRAFEDRFRGPREDIKHRQEEFLPFFKNCSNILDIGCGRGEFLELMKENGVNATGVDINKEMVDFCNSKGLHAEYQDGVSYLEQLEDDSLDGIFIDQVVEHLEPAYLVKLLGLCYRKLKPGSYLIAETVNPLSLTSFANFYIDMTHKKPVHPETLSFLFESVNFNDISKRFLSPVPEKGRLSKIPDEDIGDNKQKMFADIFNHNIEMLNNALYGPQDYAVIGKK